MNLPLRLASGSHHPILYGAEITMRLNGLDQCGWHRLALLSRDERAIVQTNSEQVLPRPRRCGYLSGVAGRLRADKGCPTVGTARRAGTRNPPAALRGGRGT